MIFRSLPVALLAFAGGLLSSQTRPDDHQDRALQFLQNGDLKDAESEMRKALKLSPSDPVLAGALGSILGREGNLREANDYLTKAVEMDPKDPLQRRNLAANQVQLGRNKEARANLELLLKVNPGDPVATYFLGMIEEREKHYVRALELLESVPDIVERRPEARVALESALYRTDQRAKAKQIAEGLSRQAIAPEIQLQAARISAANRDYTTAEETLAHMMHADAASDQSRTVLSGVLLAKASGQMEERFFKDAVDSYSRALALDPTSIEAARGKAIAEWRAGMSAPARVEFERLLQGSPSDPETLTAYGTLLLEDGVSDDASHGMRLLKLAIAANARLAAPRYRLALAELEKGDALEALVQLKAAVKLDPKNGRIHYALSRAYHLLNQPQEAVRELALFHALEKIASGSNMDAH